MTPRAASPPDLTRTGILIVEDFEAMRAILRDLLARAGASRITYANDAADALTLLERHRFDVVLCDLHLGHGKNGQQLLEEARHRQLLAPHTVWLMVSAEKTADMVAGTVESRPDDYLIKPITETLLFSRLKRQMAKKRALAPIEQAMRDREYLRALRLVEAELEQSNPHAWDLKRLQADLALHAGDYPRARAIFEEALNLRDLPWAHLGLAKIHFHEGHLDDARRELRKITDGNRAYLEAHDWLARTLVRLGELDAAQDVLLRALDTSPHAPTRQAELGEVAWHRGDLETATRAFQRAVDLARDTPLRAPMPYLWLARVQLARGDADAAQATLTTLARDMREDAGASLLAQAMRIPIHLRVGERDRAQALAARLGADLRARARALPAEAVFDLAGPLFELGDPATAGALLGGVVGNNHEHPEYLERAQELFARAGLADEGRELLAGAARAATEIMNQGVRLAHEGRLDEAIQLTRKAREQMPNNARLLLNHAYLLIAWMEKHGRDLDLALETRECIETARRLKPEEKRAGELLTRLELVGNDLELA